MGGTTNLLLLNNHFCDFRLQLKVNQRKEILVKNRFSFVHNVEELRLSFKGPLSSLTVLDGEHDFYQA